MRCEAAREAISARLDGELDAADEVAALDAHLQRCASCAAWQQDAADATRRVRLRPAVPAPGRDLADAVLAAAAARPVRQPWTAERGLLLVVGGVMLAASVAQLLVGADVHLVREAGVTDVALAVGVLSAAWQPWRAAGVLPVVLVLAAGLTVTSAADVLSGGVSLAEESLHALAPAAALLLWRLRRRAPVAPPGTPARRLEAVPDDEQRSA